MPEVQRRLVSQGDVILILVDQEKRRSDEEEERKRIFHGRVDEDTRLESLESSRK